MPWDQRFLDWLDTTNFRDRTKPIHWREIMTAWDYYELNEPKNYWQALKNKSTDWFFTEEPTQTTIYIRHLGEYKSFSGTSKEQAAQLAVRHLETYL